MSSRGIPEHRWFLRYALAVASVALATAITLALTGPAKRTPLVYAAILLAAWYGGTGPALLAVGLAALARQYYFTPPFHTLAIGSVEALVEMFIFILTALVLTVFARVQHRTQAALRQAHAELEARNQSLALSNQRLQAEIEERRQADAEVRKQASLLDLTHDSTFVMDLNTVITYWNRGAEEKYGWTRDEAVGRVGCAALTWSCTTSWMRVPRSSAGSARVRSLSIGRNAKMRPSDVLKCSEWVCWPPPMLTGRSPPA